MFKYVNVDRIDGGALIIRPHFLLIEAHAIQCFLRQPVEAIGKLLRIGKRAAAPFDHAGLAPDIIRRAPVPRRVGYE